MFTCGPILVGNLQALHINSIPREHLVVQSNSHQLLSGTKTFVQAVTMKGNLTTGRVNGFDLSELYKDVVFLNRPQEIPHTTVSIPPPPLPVIIVCIMLISQKVSNRHPGFLILSPTGPRYFESFSCFLAGPIITYNVQFHKGKILNRCNTGTKTDYAYWAQMINMAGTRQLGKDWHSFNIIQQDICGRYWF